MRTVLLCGFLAACTKPYSGPVVLSPSGTVTAPVDAYVPLYAEISSGGSPAPLVLDDVAFHCADPSVCVAASVRGSRGLEGRIAGIAVGESDVIASFRHPVNGTQSDARIHVRFVAGGSAALAVGAPLPAPRGDDLLVAREVPGQPTAWSCHHDDAMPLRDRGAPYRRAVTQNAFFSREPPAEIVPGKKHLCLSSLMQSRWNWGDHTREAVLVCASVRDGKIEGLRYYGETERYESIVLGKNGNVDDAQCPP